ncbi:hypothetical protein [Aeromonas veronii]|uniref:hypothetical protein n=1 Tax=Aeromonas veronii TaxID=654 RepID=UPI003D1CB900
MIRLTAYLFLLFSLFPWVSLRILNLDLQPYFIIFSIIFFILNINQKVPIVLFFSLFSAALSLVIVFVYGVFDFLAARAVLSYFSIFFVSFAYFLVRKKYFNDITSLLFFVNGVWLASGFLQLLFSKDILSFLLAIRTTENRGVTGLAPEPTFYGMYLILLSWLILKTVNFNFNIKYVRFFLFLNFIFIIFVAKSSMALLVALIMALIWFVSAFFSSAKGIMKIAVMGIAFGYLVVSLPAILPDDSRIKKVAETALNGPKLFFYSDASANERLKNIVYPIQLSLTSSFIPHGFHSFSLDSAKLDREYAGFFWWGEQSNKIMSGWGGMLYELGFLSLPLIMWCILSVYSMNDTKVVLFDLVSMLLVMMTAIPLAIPLFSFIVMESYFMCIKNNVKSDSSFQRTNNEAV